MKRLYTAKITVRAVLVADERGVLFDAYDALSSEMGNLTPQDVSVEDLKQGEPLPVGWDVDCLVYGGRDMTVGEAIKEYLGD